MNVKSGEKKRVNIRIHSIANSVLWDELDALGWEATLTGEKLRELATIGALFLRGSFQNTGTAPQNAEARPMSGVEETKSKGVSSTVRDMYGKGGSGGMFGQPDEPDH